MFELICREIIFLTVSPTNQFNWCVGWHSGQGAIFGVFRTDLDSRWDIFGLWDRGSTQNFDTNLVSRVVWPGEPFWEKCLDWRYFPCYHVHFFQEDVPKIVWSLNVLDSKELLNMDREVHIWTFFQRGTDRQSIYICGLSFRNGLTDGPYIMDFLPGIDWMTVHIWTFSQKCMVRTVHI